MSSKPLTDPEIAELRKVLNMQPPSREEMPDLREACERLLDEVTRARMLLRRIERQGGTYRERAACPVPGCDAVEDDDERITHKPDCELAALIGK